MRFNENELIQLSREAGDKESRVNYRHGVKNGFKDRWIKLRGNLLFCFKTNEFGAIQTKEPASVLVLEDCVVYNEDESPLPNSFTLIFMADPEKKHYFSCQTRNLRDEWIEKIRTASYMSQRKAIAQLQDELLIRTGRDFLGNLPENIKDILRNHHH